MLHEFLVTRRSRLLADIREKTAALSESKPSSEALERGLADFYDRLVEVLKIQSAGGGKAAPENSKPATTLHGGEARRLGYSVTQVVHGYGVICQAITEAADKEGSPISAAEFGTLNLSLDVAIAEALTGYETASTEEAAAGAAKRDVDLVHELRNALTCAVVAHGMISNGLVGVAGSTNAMLERNLKRMTVLLDDFVSKNK